MTTIEYRNTFHGTVARVRVPDDAIQYEDLQDGPAVLLSLRQIQRVRRTLCGMRDCYCTSNFTPLPGGEGWVAGGRIVK